MSTHKIRFGTKITYELGHSTSYKIACVPNKVSDQPVHLHSLIGVFEGHVAGSQRIQSVFK